MIIEYKLLLAKSVGLWSSWLKSTLYFLIDFIAFGSSRVLEDSTQM